MEGVVSRSFTKIRAMENGQDKSFSRGKEKSTHGRFSFNNVDTETSCLDNHFIAKCNSYGNLYRHKETVKVSLCVPSTDTLCLNSMQKFAQKRQLGT